MNGAKTNGRTDLKQWLLIAGLTLLCTSALWIRTKHLTYQHPDFNQPWDHHRYIQMAEGSPLRHDLAPYGWRILVPWVAKLFPFDLQSNFMLISFFSVWLTGFTIYHLSRNFGLESGLALIGVFLFYSLGWGPKFVLFDFWLPDAFSFLILTLAIYCLLVKKELLWAALICIGAAAKESVLFVIPLHYMFNATRVFDLRAAFRGMLLGAPAVALWLVLRAVTATTSTEVTYQATPKDTVELSKTGHDSYEYGNLWERIGKKRLENLSLNSFKSATIGTYGLLVFSLPFFSLLRNVRIFVKFAPFLLLVYSQVLFATNTERLLVLGFPALIILDLNGFDEICKKLKIKAVVFVPLTILFLVANLIKPSKFAVPLEIQAVIMILYLAVVLALSRFKTDSKGLNLLVKVREP